MALPYRSFVSSSPFCFLVGPEKKTFYVHAGLVAQSSSSLGVLVNGPMIEASQKYAILEDVDEETMTTFIEYLYTKDYTVPDPQIILEITDTECVTEKSVIETRNKFTDFDGHIEAETDNVVEPEVSWGFDITPTPKIKKKSAKKKNAWHEDSPAMQSPEPDRYGCKKDRAWAAFEEKARVQHRDAWEPYQNTESVEDYTEVFLCHARLYVFSDRHGIEPLRELSLQKLRLTLSRFHLFDERVSDIVGLVRYTYAHTMEHDQGIDKLRSLVMDYVVCKLESIFKDESFKEMLGQSGALAKDLILQLMQRLD